MARQQSMLINKKIPLNALLRTEKFELISIRSNFKYDEAGNKTNEIVGFVYTVGENINYGIFDIKVEGKYPIISPDDFKRRRENGERFYVQFDNPTVTMYWNSSQKGYADSFKADSIKMYDARSSSNPVLGDDLGLD